MEGTQLIPAKEIIIYKESGFILMGKILKSKIATIKYYGQTIVSVINHTNEIIKINGKTY